MHACSLLTEAVKTEDLALVQLLREHGANVNDRWVWGTPLEIALDRKAHPIHGSPSQARRDQKIIDLLRSAVVSAKRK